MARISKLLLVAVLISSGVLAGDGAQQANGSDEAKQSDQSCDAPYTQTDLTICAGRDVAAADKKMNDLYQKQMKHLQSTRAKALLRDSQRAWLKYRDAS
jgi:uncharacterized protein YecT (DUF1311 family)